MNPYTTNGADRPPAKETPPCSHTHRIGTLTLGFMLIFFGILFLIRTAGFLLSYRLIFRFWPVILVFLGCEILLAQLLYGKKDQTIRLVYDKTAIFLLIVLTLFSMGMAVADVILSASQLVLPHLTVETHWSY